MFSIANATYFIDEKAEVQYGKPQNHLISGNNKNRTLFHSVGQDASYTVYPHTGISEKNRIKIRNIVVEYRNNSISKQIQVILGPKHGKSVNIIQNS